MFIQYVKDFVLVLTLMIYALLLLLKKLLILYNVSRLSNLKQTFISKLSCKLHYTNYLQSSITPPFICNLIYLCYKHIDQVTFHTHSIPTDYVLLEPGPVKLTPLHGHLWWATLFSQHASAIIHCQIYVHFHFRSLGSFHLHWCTFSNCQKQ